MAHLKIFKILCIINANVVNNTTVTENIFSKSLIKDIFLLSTPPSPF